MAYFDRGTAHVYYEEAGSGVPVLLMPGWGGSIDEFTPLRTALAPSFRVIAADLPGSGKSGPQPRTYNRTYLEDDVAVLLAMLDALGASPAHLSGFSDGGECALLMAARKPSAARSLATWGAAGTLGDNAEMADLFANIVDNPIPPMQGFSDYMKAMYGTGNARIMTQSAGAAFRQIIEAGGDISRSLAGNISCPALLITGEHDFLAPPPLVADMAGAIPKGQYLEAKDASHAVHHEQPAWLLETVVDWLKKH